MSLHDRAVNREDAIVYKEGADYPVYLPVSARYEISIDKKLAHVMNAIPNNFHSNGWGKYGIGEYVFVGNKYYKISCISGDGSIVGYDLVEEYPSGWFYKS